MSNHCQEISLTIPTNVDETNCRIKTGRGTLYSETESSEDFSGKRKFAGISASMSINNERNMRKESIIRLQKRILKLHDAAICANAHNEQLFEAPLSRARYRKCEYCPLFNDCSSMKRLWIHMYSCSNGKECRFPQCVDTKNILFHYRNCFDKECPICIPVRNKINGKNTVMKHNANLSEAEKCTKSKRSKVVRFFENYANKY
uniref:histone acetyltransferase n=1 Tax=Corethron hystrix TaxID=216773 RepID=A0A7S1FP33_9STRA|mmetsp:Transcript_19818/g.44999  ORF Transcript_19818/g.44999 Transcript_19818/m.44999 type:complete len:203 (+) Transcript_19818:88-696(+)